MKASVCVVMSFVLAPVVGLLGCSKESSHAASTGGAAGFGTTGGATSGGRTSNGGAATGGKSSTVPACGAVGSPCSATSECCPGADLVCQQMGMCCAPGAGGNNVLCVDDTDCCSGHCDIGQSGRSPKQCCSMAGDACLYADDCCYGMECGEVDSKGRASCCTSLGSTCDGTTHCCGGGKCGTGCQPLSGGGCVETDHMCCLPPGHDCLMDEDCCEPSGGGGGVQCSGQICCFSSGSACTSADDCCWDDCIDGTCGGY
jgi:hypothetical protein